MFRAKVAGKLAYEFFSKIADSVSLAPGGNLGSRLAKHTKGREN
jgi:hypothetical protein